MEPVLRVRHALCESLTGRRGQWHVQNPVTDLHFAAGGIGNRQSGNWIGMVSWRRPPVARKPSSPLAAQQLGAIHEPTGRRSRVWWGFL